MLYSVVIFERFVGFESSFWVSGFNDRYVGCAAGFGVGLIEYGAQ